MTEQIKIIINKYEEFISESLICKEKAEIQCNLPAILYSKGCIDTARSIIDVLKLLIGEKDAETDEM